MRMLYPHETRPRLIYDPIEEHRLQLSPIWRVVPRRILRVDQSGPALTNVVRRLGLVTGTRNPNRNFGVSWRYFQGLCVGGAGRE